MLQRSLDGPVDKPTQILQGAMQVFLEKGYNGASMDRVAMVAGVSKQTLYSHFQDKEGLFVALVQHLAVDRFQLIFGAQSFDQDAETVLRSLAQAFLTQVASDQDYLAFMRLLIGESGRFPELGEVFIKNVTSPGHQVLSQFFRSRPDLQINDPESTAWIFMGTLVSYVLSQQLLQAKNVMPLDASALVDQLVQMILGE